MTKEEYWDLVSDHMEAGAYDVETAEELVKEFLMEESFQEFLDYVRGAFPWTLEKTFLPVPHTKGRPFSSWNNSIMHTIVRLNDTYKFSREAVASWLEWEAARRGESLEFPMPEEQ